MKKFLVMLVLALLMCSVFSGCAAEQTLDFTDLYQITETVIPVHTSRQQGHIAVPAKFNPATGTVTPLCSDPLCSHGMDSGCPFEEWREI